MVHAAVRPRLIAFLVLLLALCLLATTALAAEIQLNVSGMTLGGADQMRAQYYEFHPLTINWSFPGPVQPGDYFVVHLDPELNLHPNTDDQLPSLLYGATVIATPSVSYANNTITYTFNDQAIDLLNFSGTLKVNVSIKGPGTGVYWRDVNGDGKNDVDRYGNYIVGTKQPLTIAAGGTSQVITITHLGFPTVPESIFQVNSWLNTNVVEHAVFWNPAITGTFIQGIVEVTNNQQYQSKSLTANPPARDVKVKIQMDQAVGPFVAPAGIRISEQTGTWDTVNQRASYATVGVKYFSMADVGYVAGSDSFTVDFAALGYPNPKPPETRYIIEYFIERVTNIPYRNAQGVSNNMATITYWADLDGIPSPDDVLISYQDGAFWFPTSAGAAAAADAEPLFSFTTVAMDKLWASSVTGETPPVTKPAVQFVLLGDGLPATWYDYTVREYVTVPESALVLPSGQNSLYIRNLRYRDQAGKIIQYTADEVPPDGYLYSTEKTGNLFAFTNTYVPVEHKATKTWNLLEPGMTPPSIEVQLKRDGVNTGEVVVLDGIADGTTGQPPLSPDGSGELAPWVYTWKKLPMMPGGPAGTTPTPYAWTAVEFHVPREYQHVREELPGETKLINNYRPGTFTVRKMWPGMDIKDPTLPAVMLQLYRVYVGQTADQAVLVADQPPVMLHGEVDIHYDAQGRPYGELTPWYYTWAGLPANDGTNSYRYIAREVTAPNNYYHDAVSSASTLIVNVPGTVTRTVTKDWHNLPAGQTPPPVTFDLYQNGDATPIETVTLVSPNLQYTWTLPRFKNWDVTKAEADQVLNEYTVKERPLDRFHTIPGADGWSFVNSYILSPAPVSATKIWDMTSTDFRYPFLERAEIWLKLYRSLDGGVTLEEAPKPGTTEPLDIIHVPADAPEPVTVTWDSVDIIDANDVPYEFFVKEVDATGKDWRPLRFGKVESGLQVRNYLLPREERFASLTISKALLDNTGLNGGNTASQAVEGTPISFTFHIVGPYGYDYTIGMAAGHSITLSNLYFGAYTVTEVETQGYVADPASVTVNVSEEKPYTVVFNNRHNPVPAEDGNALSVTATKLWSGGPAADHTAPALALERMSGGSPWLRVESTYSVLPATGTAERFDYTWANLPRHDPRGFEYLYRVVETHATNGTAVVNGNTYRVAADGNTITNTYVPYPPVEGEAPARVTLTGTPLAAGDFHFTITDKDGRVQTSTNAADGTITFDPLHFDKPGVYEYTIRQMIGSREGVTYDTAVYVLRYEFRLDSATNTLVGGLVSLQKDGKALPLTDEVIFRNLYTPPPVEPPVDPPEPTYQPVDVVLGARKVLTGRLLKANEFRFVLRGGDGQVIEEVGNTADGRIDFGPRRFIGPTQPGRPYIYTIEEVKGTGANITYDATRYSAEVTVTADGEVLRYSVQYLKDGTPWGGEVAFHNRYDPPRTGDSFLGTAGLLALLALIPLAGWLVLRRKAAKRS